MATRKQRPGDVSAAIDPNQSASDARLMFIGRIKTPWQTLDDCPKNLIRARELGQSASIEIDTPWRPALAGLEKFNNALVLYWMDEARRDLILQQPSHRPEPAGTFALRSPARPNPIALAVVRILSIDQAEGTLEIDAIDCLDGTPLLDIKPWFASIDMP